MDFPYGSEYHHKFVTNVGLITSNGPNGPNIMAAEWTYLVSYSPAHILVSIGPRKATAENIRATKVFGVSITANDQNVTASIAGGSSGHTIDKIAALKEMGFKFSNGKELDVLLVEGSALQAECRVIEVIDKGDHILFLGEVVHATTSEKEPIVYHQTKYWKVGQPVLKPSDVEREKNRAIVEKHHK